MPLGIVIFHFFFDFWNQKPSHVGSKTHAKIDFMLTNPESPKLLETLYKFYGICMLSGLFKIKPMFEYIFDPTWLGFWLQKSLKMQKKHDSKRHHKIDQFLERFLIDVCSVLDAKLVPCWPPLSA